MASGVISKNPKKKVLSSQLFSGQNSPEYSKQSQHPSSNKKKTFSLSGILGLNQSIDINKGQESSSSFSQELYQPSYLNKETTLLMSQEKEELKKAINELIAQIKKLGKSTKKVKKELVDATLQPVTEVNQYQVSFLKRFKKFLQNITKNMDQAKDWIQMFKGRSKQKGKFWNRAKKGGQKYMFSGEHSASRSAG